MQKQRGRPRLFDERTARQAILQVFWEKGFAATSLDDLSKATGMVRPSLYGAFGSKVDMYLMSMDVFLESLADIRTGLRQANTPQEAVNLFLLGLIAAYYGDDTDKQLGCFLVGTAIAEAPSNPEIRDALNERLKKFNQMLTSALVSLAPKAPVGTIRFAVEQGAATMHSISVRARAGESREVLTEFAASSARFIATLLED